MSPLKIYAPIRNLPPPLSYLAERRWDVSKGHVGFELRVIDRRPVSLAVPTEWDDP